MEELKGEFTIFKYGSGKKFHFDESRFEKRDIFLARKNTAHSFDLQDEQFAIDTSSILINVTLWINK